MDDGVLHHREVGVNLLLRQGEEGGGDEEEGYQGQPHLWPRGNVRKIMRPCASQNSYLTKYSLSDIWFGGGR